MATIYDHISQNKRRTALLVLFFPVSLAILAWITLYLLFVFGGVNASSAQTAQTADNFSIALFGAQKCQT